MVSTNLAVEIYTRFERPIYDACDDVSTTVITFEYSEGNHLIELVSFPGFQY